MTRVEITRLTPGQVYRVCHRQYSLDNRRHMPSRRVRRVFLRLVTRATDFGEFPCAVFTSRLDRRNRPAQELSIPHFDLVSADHC